MFEGVGYAGQFGTGSAAEHDALEPGHITDVPLPGAFDPIGRRIARRPFLKVQPHGSEVAAVRRPVAAPPLSRRCGGRAGDDADAGNRRALKLTVDGMTRFGESFGSGERRREWRAHRQTQIRLYVVGHVGLFECDHPHEVGPQEQQCRKDNHHASGNGDRYVANRPGDHRHDDSVADVLHPDPDPCLQIAQRTQAPLPLMGQVCRQYEKRLDQRDQQHEEDDVGKDPQQL